MEVLISAYACEPGKGSEQGSGWGWVMQISRFANTHVITRSNNREIIEEEINRLKIKGPTFHYIDLPDHLKKWKKGEKNLYVYYLIWQLIALHKALKLYKKYHFDVVHQLTFGSFWLPNFLALVPTKFIWGPFGGAEIIPMSFIQSYGFINSIKEFGRLIMIKTLPRINPLFYFNCKRASLLLTKSGNTRAIIPKSSRDKAYVLVSGGMPFVNPPIPLSVRRKKQKRKLKIVAVGRLLYIRNFDLAIKAFHEFSRNSREHELVIVGDGPEMDHLKKIIKEHNIKNVILKGKLSRKEAFRQMLFGDIFLFPTIKDAGPWALFEAMFIGLPIICLDISGIEQVVDNESAIKIKPKNPDYVVEKLTKGLNELAENPKMRKEIGLKGQKRLYAMYDWPKKGEKMYEFYKMLLH